MTETEVSFVSLCYVEELCPGYKQLYRLADIEGNELCPPRKSDRRDGLFENRDRLEGKSGPSAIGAVGVWEWTVSPSRYDPEKDYVAAYCARDYSPVRVFMLPATVSSLEGVVEQLKSGAVQTEAYFCDTLFCCQPRREQFLGVLCRADEFEIADGCARLLEGVSTLPSYTLHKTDIYNWYDKNLRFLRKLQIGEPSGHILVGSAHEIIRKLVLERATWPLFKECVGATKAEWRNSKALLEKVCNESFYELVAQELKYTPEQAKQAVDDFVHHASTLIESGDIDADVLAQIAMNHDELRRQCEEAVASKWREDHAAEIVTAEQEVKAAEERLSSAEERRNSLAAEIDAAQGKLDQLRAEIEQQEALGQDVSAAVRLKIADAQKDMADFIASLSMFLPQSNAAAVQEKNASCWRYIGASEGQYSDDDIEFAENWDNEFDAISQNLANSFTPDSELSMMLASFLYSTHINNTPVLIAGPAGCEIAEALSVSMYAGGSGRLLLGDECDYDIADAIKGYGEQIISVQNMFGKGWFDELPQTLGKLEKQVVWTHPYVEDLVIEPKGLYNYMLPVLSECFIRTAPSWNLCPGKRTNNFKEYTFQKKRLLLNTTFKRLGLSKLLLNQFELVISDAKAILGDPAKEKDMEVLFGLLPFCVLTGRCDILKETMETESGISKSIKAEAARYIEEE